MVGDIDSKKQNAHDITAVGVDHKSELDAGVAPAPRSNLAATSSASNGWMAKGSSKVAPQLTPLARSESLSDPSGNTNLSPGDSSSSANTAGATDSVAAAAAAGVPASPDVAASAAMILDGAASGKEEEDEEKGVAPLEEDEGRLARGGC